MPLRIGGLCCDRAFFQILRRKFVDLAQHAVHQSLRHETAERPDLTRLLARGIARFGLRAVAALTTVSATTRGGSPDSSHLRIIFSLRACPDGSPLADEILEVCRTRILASLRTNEEPGR